MKHLIVAAGAAIALAAPGTALAATSADQREAKRECVTLKKAAKSSENFRSLVAHDAKKAMRRSIQAAFKDCVRARKADAARERRQARSSAVEECRALHPRASKRGKPAQGEKRNAFGKCVSAKAKAKNDRADEKQRERSLNPAKACRAEQTANREQFEATYGTQRNAFGKCVSAKAKAQQDDEQQS